MIFFVFFCVFCVFCFCVFLFFCFCLSKSLVIPANLVLLEYPYQNHRLPRRGFPAGD